MIIRMAGSRQRLFIGFALIVMGLLMLGVASGVIASKGGPLWPVGIAGFILICAGAAIALAATKRVAAALALHPDRTARIAALCIGGIFVLLGLGVASLGFGKADSQTKAPGAILLAAGLAFVFAGLSVASQMLHSSSTLRKIQISLGLAALAALATVAIWAFTAPGDSTSSFSGRIRL